MLRGLEPPATDHEIRAAALQYVRKVGALSGVTAANRPAVDRAVEAMNRYPGRFVAIRPVDLLALLLTRAPPVKETPTPQAQVPPREFSEYLLAAAGAQGVPIPARARATHRVNPPPRQPKQERSKRERSQGDSGRSNPNWA